VRLHRLPADQQCRRDLRVGQALPEQHEHLPLPAGEQPQLGRRLGRRPLPGEAVEQPAGDRRSEDRLAGADDPDRVHQLRGRGVLEYEAARPGQQRAGDVLVEVEHREDEDLRPAGREVPDQLAGRGDAVEQRHPDVHHHHVRHQQPGPVDRFGAVGRLADHFDGGLGAQRRRQAGPDEGLVVADQDPQHQPGSGTGRLTSTR